MPYRLGKIKPLKKATAKQLKNPKRGQIKLLLQQINAFKHGKKTACKM